MKLFAIRLCFGRDVNFFNLIYFYKEMMKICKMAAHERRYIYS